MYGFFVYVGDQLTGKTNLLGKNTYNMWWSACHGRLHRWWSVHGGRLPTFLKKKNQKRNKTEEKRVWGYGGGAVSVVVQWCGGGGELCQLVWFSFPLFLKK